MGHPGSARPLTKTIPRMLPRKPRNARNVNNTGHFLQQSDKMMMPTLTANLARGGDLGVENVAFHVEVDRQAHPGGPAHSTVQAPMFI
jgi:hypothetical protein